ncbi:phosphate ABC transporter permease subunit PstC [Bombilactobacillus thymidiniphilus]|uniref:Phosphate transport system permease protein n=1 Tax=Bombilactobacillus thymidiniphilus TaxID=2923363 RepID=A0ABY4PC30_9LACO|nr:phosphate ABC transporter permease subunit PstC [Bombilactobacillus thymidiniphilus]UQS83314.1 phosphate ABC transporter permease subunit PstC [Bombilactobacillus thymidiniphilus]
MDPIAKSLKSTSVSAKIERRGKLITQLCTMVIVLLVIAIFAFIASKGVAIFGQDHGSVLDFFTKTTWNPDKQDAYHRPLIGALPMIVGSFAVTLLSVIVATPFALAAAIFMVEISPKSGKKFLQPVIELLVGIPSVVYGFIGLVVIVPSVQKIAGGSGFGILAGSLVLFVMILPTITSMSVDALKAVPRYYREASLALGATRWQTTYKVVLRAGAPGIMTAVIFGMSRAFGEALAVQMVIGNAILMPTNLASPATTLTSILTMNVGNTIMGTTANNALWTLALLLLLMSLIFNIIIKYLAKRGELK